MSYTLYQATSTVLTATLPNWPSNWDGPPEHWGPHLWSRHRLHLFLHRVLRGWLWTREEPIAPAGGHNEEMDWSVFLNGFWDVRCLLVGANGFSMVFSCFLWLEVHCVKVNGRNTRPWQGLCRVQVDKAIYVLESECVSEGGRYM